MNCVRATAMAAVLLSILAGPESIRAQQDAGDEGERFQAMARRYHGLLQRRPSRGTAFDLLYRHYLEAGQLEELVTHYEAQIEDSPDDASALLVLALIYERRGQLQEALEHFQRAESADEDDYRAAYYRAQLAARMQQPEEAATAYRTALQREPDRADLLDIHKELGRLLSRQGKTEEAIRVWNALVETFPEDRFVLEELARLLAEEGHLDEAIRRYEQLIETAGRDLQRKLKATVAIGRIQVQQGKMQTAIETFEKALSGVRPGGWNARDIRDRIERIFVRSGDLEGLAEYYRTRLESDPNDVESRVRLATTLRNLEQPEAAVAEYRGVLEVAPSRQDVREELIQTLVQTGRVEEAIAVAEERVEQTPEDVEALAQLGQLTLQYGADQSQAQHDAIAVWSQIADVRRNDPVLAVQTAELLRDAAGIRSMFTDSEKIEQNRERRDSALGQAALKFYREAVARAPQAPEYREYLGEYLWSIGRKRDAVRTWRQIAAAPRDTVENLKRLAELLHSANAHREALSAIRRAIVRDSRRYDLHKLAAVLLAEQHRYSEAIGHIERMEALADVPELQRQALQERVQILTQAGRLSEELTRLSQRLSQERGTVRDYWLAGLMAFAQRRMNAALAHLQEALEQDPQNVQILEAKAEVHQQAGDLGGAAQQFRRLAQADLRRRSEHLNRVIELELQLGRFDAARETAEELVRISPGNPDALQRLAEIHFRAGEAEAGLETLRRAVQRDPRGIDPRLALANQLVQQQQFREAIEHLWRAFELADDAATKLPVVKLLAEQYVIVGRFPELIDRLRRLRQSQEDGFESTLCLVEAYLEAQDYASARDELNELLAQRPNDTQVLGQLVALSEQLDDPQTAVRYQEQLAELSPDKSQLERLASLYTQLGQNEKASEVWQTMARETGDESELLTVLDRAARNGQFEQVITLAEPEWSRRNEDWRIGTRLMLAYWHANRRDEANRLAERILNMIPSESFEPPSVATGANSGRSGTVNRAGSRTIPALMQRLELPRSLLVALNNARAFNLSRLPKFPASLDDAQLVATIVQFAQARSEERADEYVANLRSTSEGNPAQMRRLVWIAIADRDNAQMAAGMEPILEQLIEHNPHDAEARLVLFALPFIAGGPGLANTDLEQLAETIAPQYEWFVENRPQMAAYLAEPYFQVLSESGQTERSQKLIEDLINEARNLVELQRAFQAARRIPDHSGQSSTDLLARILKRYHELKPQPGRFSMARGLTENAILQAFVQVATQAQDWEAVVRTFGEYMDETHPATVSGPVTAMAHTSSRPGPPRASASSPSSNRQPLSFPSPTPWLDAERLRMLQTVSDSLGDAGRQEMLQDLVATRLEDSEGIARQCWQLVDVILDWQRGRRQEATEQLEQFVEEFSGHTDLRMLLAAAYAGQNDYRQALTTLENVTISFGSRAKELEQSRLALAQLANDTERGKKAALRLFRMRLTSDEQVELADTLQEYGLGTHSEQLRSRALQTAGNNTDQLYRLMQAASDADRSVEIARLLIQRVPLSFQNDQNRQYRQRALQVLKQHGQLESLVTRTEEQYAAAPTSTRLVAQLLELYDASGQREKMETLLERTAENPPADPQTAYGFATMLLQSGKNDAALQQLAAVWKKDPSPILSVSSSQIAGYYAQDRHVQQLAKHIGSISGTVSSSQAYQLINVVERIERETNDVAAVSAAYDAALKKLPSQYVGQALSEYSEYLKRKERHEALYALYKRFLLPTGADSKRFATNRLSMRIVNGVARTPLMDFVQSAQQSEAVEEFRQDVSVAIEQHGDWKPIGEILLAVADAHIGQEQALTELARRFADDEAYRNAFDQWQMQCLVTMRAELAQGKRPESLRAAIRLWQLGTEDRPDQRLSSSEAERFASLHMRLDEPDEARAVLLQAASSLERGRSQSPNAVRTGNLPPDHVFSETFSIAESLRGYHFHFDAIRLYDKALRQASAIPENNYTRRNTVPRAHRGLAESLRAVLSEDPAPLVHRLIEELKEDETDLPPYFAVADPTDDSSRATGPSPAGHPAVASAPQSDSVFLMPALLAAARASGQLEELQTCVARDLEQLSEDADPVQRRALEATQDLIALMDGSAEQARAVAKRWVAESHEDPHAAADSLTWTVAFVALQRDDTTSLGQELTIAVMNAAGNQSNAARQQAAVNLLIQSAGEDSDEMLTELLDGPKLDPQLAFHVAQAHFRKDEHARGIQWLEPVWKSEPALLMEELDNDFINHYVQADNLSALAAGLRQVNDRRAVINGSNEMANMFNDLPTRTEFVREAVAVYQAAHTLLVRHSNGSTSYLTSRFEDYLEKLPLEERVLSAYEQVVLPSESYQGEITLGDDWIAKARQASELQPVRQSITKSTAAHPNWKPKGEFLLAMVAVQNDNEQPLLEVARKRREDSTYAARLGRDGTNMLRQELSQCESREAAELALELWQPDSQRELTQTNSTSTYATTNAAALHVKLGQREQARSLLMSALRRPIRTSSSSRSYQLRQQIGYQDRLADALAEHDFHLEAITAYQQTLQIDVSTLDGNDYVHTVVERTRDAARSAVRDAASNHTEKYLDELLVELSQTQQHPNLTPFFAVFCQASDPNSSTANSSQEEAPDSLLPALLAYAKSAGRLQPLSETVAAARRRLSDDQHIAALEVLVALEQDRFEEAARDLRTIADAVASTPGRASGSHVWLLAESAIEHAETREMGWELAEAVIRSSDSTLITRQSAALAILVGSLTKAGEADRASEIMDRFGKQQVRSPQERIQMAQALMKRDNFDAALSVLEPAWDENPEAVLRVIRELAPAYAAAGRIDELGKALDAVDDSNARSRYDSQVAYAARELGQREEHREAALQLFPFAVDFSASTTQRGMTYSYWTSLLQTEGRNADAWKLYQQAILPDPKKPVAIRYLADHWIALSDELDRLDLLAASVRQAAQTQPDWQPKADLLLAMVALRQGDPAPMTALAKKYRFDEQYAGRLSSTSDILRTELPKADSTDALEVAAELWESYVQPYREGRTGSTTSYEYFTSLADIYARLGKRYRARALYREAELREAPGYSASYLPYYEFRRRTHIADSMLKTGFPLEALRLYRENVALEGTEVAQQRNLSSAIETQQTAIVTCLHRVIAKRLESCLEQFEAALQQGDVERLNVFFTINPRPWSDAEFQEFPEEVRTDSERTLQLLPALLRFARQHDRLEHLQALAASAESQIRDRHVLRAIQWQLECAENGAVPKLEPSVEFSRSPNQNVQALALMALAEHEAPAASRAILKAAQQTPSLQRLAVNRLAAQNTAAAAEALAELLTKANLVNRIRIERALMRMKTPRAKELFRMQQVAFDDFEGGPQLDWQILQAAPEHISYEKRPGSLTITGQNVAFYGAETDHVNVFIIEPPPDARDDVDVTLAFDNFHPTTTFQQAALLVWNGPDDFLKVSYEYGTASRPRLTVVPELQAKVTGRQDHAISFDTERIWLRLRKHGDEYAFSTSTDGEHFRTHGSVTWSAPQPPRFGFMAATPQAPPLEISFDSFELRHAVGETVE